MRLFGFQKFVTEATKVLRRALNKEAIPSLKFMQVVAKNLKQNVMMSKSNWKLHSSRFQLFAGKTRFLPLTKRVDF